MWCSLEDTVLQKRIRCAILVRQSLLQVVSIVVGAAVSWYRFLGLDGTEFSGGWLTGPMLNVQFSGTIIITTALLIAFVYRRVSAWITLAAALLCLPLHLYFLVPGAWPGVSKNPVQRLFHFNSLDFWSVTALVVAACIAISVLQNASAR